jgi:hypothetical protein
MTDKQMVNMERERSKSHNIQQKGFIMTVYLFFKIIATAAADQWQSHIEKQK